MAFTPLISPIKCNSMPSFSPLFFSLSCRSYKLCLSRKLHRNAYSYCHSLPPFSYQSLAPRSFQRTISPIASDANNSASGEEDDNQELFDTVADESPCVCKLLSFFQAFQGKKQVLDILSYLRKITGKNFKIVVKWNLGDGMDVGVKWRFEWQKMHVPLGKGFSLHISQTYQGKAIIRNIEMFVEPLLLHFEPFRLKVMAYYVALTARKGSLVSPQFDNKLTKILCIMLPLLSLAVFSYL